MPRRSYANAFQSLCFVILVSGLPSARGQVAGTKLWQVTLPGTVLSSPAIAEDGTIYVGVCGSYTARTDMGRLYAISPQGTTNWFVRTFGDVRASPAIGPDGSVVLGTTKGYVYSFTANGTTNWVRSTSLTTYYSYIGTSPAIGSDGSIYVNLIEGYDPRRADYPDALYAFRPDGSTNWFLRLNAWTRNNWDDHVLWSSPAIGPDGMIYVATRNGRLYALSPRGTTNWVCSIGAETMSSPAIGGDGTIYVGSDDHKLYAIGPGGFKKWEFLTGDIIESSAATDGQMIYFASLDRNVYALDRNGQQQWVLTNFLVAASVAVAKGGLIYAAEVDTSYKGLMAINSAGSNTWTLKLDSWPCLSSPAIGPDGTVYIGAGSNLFAISGTNLLADSPWPMFRGNVKHTGRSIQRGIQQPVVLPDKSFGMTLTMEPTRLYSVEISTNLVDWTELDSFVSSTTTNQFIDTTAPNRSEAFYRLKTGM